MRTFTQKVEPSKLTRATPVMSGLAGRINTLSQSGGQPLSAATRAFFEPRFGHDFSRVRVHSRAETEQATRALNAQAFTLGSDIAFGAGQYAPASQAGRKLLAHELTHVIQQTTGSGHGLVIGNAVRSLQRKIEFKKGAVFATLTRRQMLRKWRKIRWQNRSMRRRAKAVMLDMHASADGFYFDSNAELRSEIEKRVNTSLLTQQTQTAYRGGKISYGYPFTSRAILYGPRVNYSARDYWTPRVPDNYAWRGMYSNRAKNARLRRLPRSQRHQVYGDPAPGYEWSLTSAGKTDPYSAIRQLFVPQSKPRRRSLMHCDYMLATVHFRAFMRSTTKANFKSRVTQYGADRIKLTYNMDWAHLRADLHFGGTNPLGSLQLFVPKSKQDLVIGDHVTFSNHATYDLINQRVGNAWRLENAVLIYKRRGKDVFLGHGSGRKTDFQMRKKLADEYNKVARRALRLVRKAKRGNIAAKLKLQRDFNVFKVGSEYRIKGTVDGVSQNKKLTTIKPWHVPGLKNPKDMSKMYLVVRPRESMR